MSVADDDDRVTNVVVAGLGGQGVITASDVVAEAAFRSGLDVKKSEIHGMSQRGGSVTSDVRFGARVLSPTTTPGEVDFLLVLAADQVENNRPRLRPGGVLIAPDFVDETKLSNKRSLNVALVGALSGFVPTIERETWLEAVRAKLPPALHAVNETAFEVGRAAAAERLAGGVSQ